MRDEARASSKPVWQLAGWRSRQATGPYPISGGAPRHGLDIAGSRPDQPSGQPLFARVCQPASDPTHREDACASIFRETDGFQQKGGIKFDIGFQHTIRFSAMQSIERHAFYTLRTAEPSAHTLERPKRRLERFGAGVPG